MTFLYLNSSRLLAQGCLSLRAGYHFEANTNSYLLCPYWKKLLGRKSLLSFGAFSRRGCCRLYMLYTMVVSEWWKLPSIRQIHFHRLKCCIASSEIKC